MAQSSHQGNSPVLTTPGRAQRVGGNSPPSGSSRPDSWIHADGNPRDLRAICDQDGDAVLSGEGDGQVGRNQIDHVPNFPHGSGRYPAHGADMAPLPRDSGGFPARARGRSRSPGRGGCRVHGVRVVERVELELAPDIEELYQRGRELHEESRIAQEQVQWCEQNMVPIEHHARAKREAQLLNEQAAEMIYRQQHERYIKLVRNDEEEKNRALQEGQRARQELESKAQELQRVHESAGAHVQQKDQPIERTLAEANERRRAAQERDDIAQLLELG